MGVLSYARKFTPAWGYSDCLRLHSSLRIIFRKRWSPDKALVLLPVLDQVHGCSTPESPFFLTFVGPCIVNVFLSITNKMQLYIIFFFNVNVLHVSSGSSVHHQELKTVHTASVICQLVCCLASCWLCLRIQRARLNGICTTDVIKSLVVPVVKNSEDTIHPKSNKALRKIRIRTYKLPWMFVQGILDNNLRDHCPLRADHQLNRDVPESSEAISRVKRARS